MVAEREGVNDLSVAVETSSRLQDVEAFEEVDGESLPEEETLRKSLKRLSVRDGVAIKVSIIVVKINTNYTDRLRTSESHWGTDLSWSIAVF